MTHFAGTRSRRQCKLALRHLLTSVAVVAAMFLSHPTAHAQADDQGTGASSDVPPPPPPPPPDEGGPDAEPAEIVPLQPGEAVVTRFSNTIEQNDEAGKPQTVIDINGTSASIVDIRRPGDPAAG